VQKAKEDGFTEDKLFELLKKGENEEIISTLTAESTSLLNASEKGPNTSPRPPDPDVC
jgi:hypothetical protein